MFIGVSPYGATREEALSLARLTKDAGLDGLIIGDGLITTPEFPVWSGGVDALVELAWLAGAVSMESYGVSAAVLPARDPRVLAKQASSLNAVTGGRAHLVVAAGFWDHDARLFGYPFEERGARFDEGIRALQAIWRNEPEFHGRFWSWQAAGPITPCGGIAPPELWLAGKEGTMRRAIAYGLPWQPPPMSPEELAPRARRFFEEGGKRLTARVRMSLIEPTASARPFPFPTLAGDAHYLADQLSAYADAGVDYASIVAGFDFDSCTATIEAVGRSRR